MSMKELLSLMQEIDDEQEPIEEKVVKRKKQQRRVNTSKTSSSEINSLKIKIERLNQRLTEIETAETSIKNPFDLYISLLKKYDISISSSQTELNLLTSDDVENADDLKFLKRYKKNRTDFDLYYSIISK